MDVGWFRVGEASALIRSNDEMFAAAAQWSFRDLALPQNEPVPGSSVTVFDVKRRDHPWVDWGIWRDDAPCETTLIEGYVLFQLQWEFNRVILERREPSLHAAAVRLGDRAVVLSGSSTSGKTTFAGWLTSRGATYLGDEIAALSADGLTVDAFARPLGLRHGGPLESLVQLPGGLDRQFQTYEMLVPASALGQVEPEGRYPIGAIVFPRFVPDVEAAIRVLPASEAFESVCGSCPTLATRDPSVFAVLADLVRSVPTVDLITSDLGRATTLLFDFFAERGIVSAEVVR